MVHHPKSSIRNSGFTLVELLTVIAIISILAGLIIGLFGYASSKAAESRAIADMQKIKGALEEYRLQYGAYPNGCGVMTSNSFELVRNQLTNTMQNPVTDLTFVDPWGNGYGYSNSAKFVYTLWSEGAETDTYDNITSGVVGM